MKIDYRSLFDFLSKTEGMSMLSALRSIFHLRRVSPALLADLKDYMETGTIPERSVHGVSFGMLVDQEGFTPSRAILFLDWLEREPEAAIRYMASGRFRMPFGSKVVKEEGTGSVRIVEQPLTKEEREKLAAVRKEWAGENVDAKKAESDDFGSTEDIDIPEE